MSPGDCEPRVNDPSGDVNALSRCAALSDLDAATLEIIRQHCTVRTFDAGETLIRQGDAGDSLLLLLEGGASAEVRDAEGNRQPVGDFGPYEIIGEMAILTGEQRTADVVARRKGSALQLSTERFQQLVVQHPELGVVLTHMVAERLGEQSADGLGGKTVDRYRIRRCIGRGAMAIVYEAEEQPDGATVALKMMSHRLIYERGAMARFQREADMLLQLEHENVARALRSFSAYKTCFIAMEFCDGGDLAAMALAGFRPDEKEVLRIIGQIATGLIYLHGRNVVHRDLKPRNVLTTRAGVLKLADFGLARALATPIDQGLTLPGTILGTPNYMAPEQFEEAPCSPASDVYALGCVALELLTGEPPFQGKTLWDTIKLKRGHSLPPRRKIGRGISRKLHGFLCACLEPDPDERDVDLHAAARWAAALSADTARFQGQLS